MTQENDFSAPRSLQLDRDGTEDIAIICDADGDELVRSRPFWLPEGDDPVPVTLAAMQLMAVAPKLLSAAKATLGALDLILKIDNPANYTKADWQIDPIETLRAVIIEAEAGGRVA